MCGVYVDGCVIVCVGECGLCVGVCVVVCVWFVCVCVVCVFVVCVCVPNCLNYVCTFLRFKPICCYSVNYVHTSVCNVVIEGNVN